MDDLDMDEIKDNVIANAWDNSLLESAYVLGQV